MKTSFALLAAAAVVGASPYPQGVTVAIAPSGSAPSGFKNSYNGTFGIAVQSVGASAPQSIATVTAVSQIRDGQVQAPATSSRAATTSVASTTSSRSSTTSSSSTTAAAVTTRATTSTTTSTRAASTPATTRTSSSSSSSSSSRATTAATRTTTLTAQVVTQITDGQVQAPTVHARAASNSSSVATPSASAVAAGLTACRTSSTLNLTLANGVLHDSQNRTGYIAGNYQFQFDAPAQHGALYTAGWSVGSNGSLALGGSAIFYECLSGSFYNLYAPTLKPIPAQCKPVVLEVVSLKSC